MMARRILFAQSALSLMLGIPAIAADLDRWLLRPGLWEVSLTSVFTPEQRASMEHLNVPLPEGKPVTDCLDSVQNDLSKSLFSPLSEPPGSCSQKILSETDNDKVVEDDCRVPLSVAQPPGAPPRQPLFISGVMTRHILKTGDASGMTDSVEIKGGYPDGSSLNSHLRWLGGDCKVEKHPN